MERIFILQGISRKEAWTAACDEVAQCEGTEVSVRMNQGVPSSMAFQHVEKDGVEHDDVQQVNAIAQA